MVDAALKKPDAANLTAIEASAKVRHVSAALGANPAGTKLAQTGPDGTTTLSQTDTKVDADAPSTDASAAVEQADDTHHHFIHFLDSPTKQEGTFTDPQGNNLKFDDPKTPGSLQTKSTNDYVPEWKPPQLSNLPLDEQMVASVKAMEGEKLCAYRCPAGVRTIGYGHTGADVAEGMQISETQADALLRQDLKVARDGVDRIASARGIKLSEHERAALTSFAFNVGVGALSHSNIMSRLQAGDHQGAADALLDWDKAHVNGQLVRLRGLTGRRQFEREMFLKPDTPVMANAAGLKSSFNAPGTAPIPGHSRPEPDSAMG